MARTAITVTTVTHDGVAWPSAFPSVPASDHEIADNDARIILVMENVSGSTRTVTIQGGRTYGDPPIALEDRTISIAAGATKVAGPFSAMLFNQDGDTSDAAVLVDVDGANGDVEFRALKVPFAVA